MVGNENGIELSIVIPTYNSSNYLKRCVSSIYEYKDMEINFEVIIVDDGSTDDTSKACAELAKNAKTIRYIKQKNQGASAARNTGIKYARGEYITFIDSDDIVNVGWQSIIEKSIRESNQSEMIVVSNSVKKDIMYEKYKNILYSYITTINRDNIQISGPYSKIYKTEFLKKNKIVYDTRLINGEDMLFCLESAIMASSVFVKKGTFYKVFHNKQSTTSRYDERLIESEERLYDGVKKITKGLKKDDQDNILKAVSTINIRTVIVRARYIDNYNNRKRYLKTIRNKEFIINRLNEIAKQIPYKSRIMILLFRMRLYGILSYIIVASRQKEYFEEI